MADSSSRRHLSDALTSRRSAWIPLGVALIELVALFGAFESAQAPARAS